MSDPFGDTPTPWWRRIWRRDRPASAPKRYTVPAGAVGPLAALLLPDWYGIDHPTKLILGCALFFGPPGLVEIWWKRRQRRTAEQLGLPAAQERAVNRAVS
jgi:hypothetical protein